MRYWNGMSAKTFEYLIVWQKAHLQSMRPRKSFQRAKCRDFSQLLNPSSCP